MIMAWTRVIATQRERSGQIKAVFEGRINRTWWLFGWDAWGRSWVRNEFPASGLGRNVIYHDDKNKSDETDSVLLRGKVHMCFCGHFFSDPVVSFIYSIYCLSPMDLVIYLYSIYYVLKFELGCTCCVISLYSSCLLCVGVVFDAVWYFWCHWYIWWHSLHWPCIMYLAKFIT